MERVKLVYKLPTANLTKCRIGLQVASGDLTNPRGLHRETHWFTGSRRRPNQPMDVHRPAGGGPSLPRLLVGTRQPTIPRLFGGGDMIFNDKHQAQRISLPRAQARRSWESCNRLN